MGVSWGMACNRTTYSCGCAAWDQWEYLGWVRKAWLCALHAEKCSDEEAG